jgi:hypothetical protein
MIICRQCRAEAHRMDSGLYATGCDCVPLELVEMSPASSAAWDLLLQATEARDIAIDNARERVEHEWRGIIELRRAAFMATVKREKDNT